MAWAWPLKASSFPGLFPWLGRGPGNEVALTDRTWLSATVQEPRVVDKTPEKSSGNWALKQRYLAFFYCYFFERNLKDTQWQLKIVAFRHQHSKRDRNPWFIPLAWYHELPLPFHLGVHPGADLGGGCRGCATPPPPSEMKLSSLFLRIRF